MMFSLNQPLLNACARAVGHPREIEQVLEANPSILHVELPARTISYDSVLAWSRLMENGALRFVGWGKDFSTDYASLPPLVFSDFLQVRERGNWLCDIRDVQGLSAGRGLPSGHVDLDQWAEATSPDLIADLSKDNIRANLSWDELPVTSDNCTFYIHRWDGRLFLMNHGGSHHFAAARYISGKLKMSTPIVGKLYEYDICAKATNILRERFHFFAVSSSTPQYGDLISSIQKLEASFYLRPADGMLQDTTLLLFPKHERRSRNVAQILQVYGAFEAGALLTAPWPQK